MSEWKKQVENKAKLTAIHYVLDESSAAGRAETRPQKNSRASSDMIYGLFAIFMGIAMAIIAVGFYATATGGYTADGTRTAAVYGILCLVMTVSGISNVVRSFR